MIHEKLVLVVGIWGSGTKNSEGWRIVKTSYQLGCCLHQTCHHCVNFDYAGGSTIFMAQGSPPIALKFHSYTFIIYAKESTVI
jgi:hypothetical protein